MGPENEDPRRDPEPRPEPGCDPPTSVTLNFQTTQEDPELRTIEAILQLLQVHTYETRVRALRYIQSRIEGTSS